MTDHPGLNPQAEAIVPITINIPESLVKEFLGYMSDGGGEYGFMEAVADHELGFGVTFDYSFKNRLIEIKKVCDD
ncbi:hypothetical protein CPT_Muldoon_112 [Serratia phage Muldoon]|uniref:Uncharacterized protein n=1 Tax=Serratia phage Muldoon TaxID=2601678 RepID=A0A5P8PH84_9CAUD|nr:hypothetical protein HYP94_gp111 [Serratia phage Muldoon]QFR56067.1 hypothetical protein CPT_Muldoon_112 [Serratia phage Muldoon]